MRVPAAVLAVPLLAGCAWGAFLAGQSAVVLAICSAGAAAIALVAATGFVLDDLPADAVCAVAIGAALSGVSLGSTAARRAASPDLLRWFEALDPEVRAAPIVLEGVLRDDAALSPGGVSLTLDVARGTSGRRPPRVTVGGVRLTVSGSIGPDRLGEWRAGRTIRAAALLRVPGVFGDPGVPDDRWALARRGVVLLGTVKSGALVDVVSRGSPMSEAAASARGWSRVQIARHVGRWNADSGAIATAIAIGDRSGLSEPDERRLQDSGTYHVIAISGGNIAILAAIVMGLLRVLRVRPELAAGIALAALLFYGEVAAGGASVARAIAAACIVLGGRMLDQRGPALNALSVAAVAGVAASPLAVFDGGFVLSFGATLGILLGASALARRLGGEAPAREPGQESKRRALRAVANAGMALSAATICAEIALAPVGASLFSRITFAGLVLNFVAIPLMAITQAAALVTLALGVIAPGLAQHSGYVCHLAASSLVRSASLVDLAPWMVRGVAAPAAWLVCAYYVSALLLLRSRTARLGAAGISVAGALMVGSPNAAARFSSEPPRPGTLRLVFLDVGQGDATLVRLPDGRAMLIDAGGMPGSSFDVGERVVAPALRAFGVRAIDTLALTHGDPDHVGGAPAVLRLFRPRTIWEGVPVPPHAALRALGAAAAAAGASWRTLQAGDREAAGGVEIRVLHPPPPDWERQRVRNEDSVVIELRLGDVSVVLPGDIGREAEAILMPRLAPAPIVIIKAPHHGSATSSTEPFVDRLHPSAVVFSAGRGNRFGHPAPAVVARYRDAGSLVFRTDEDGAITLDTDGRSVTLWTWSGRRLTLPVGPVDGRREPTSPQLVTKSSKDTMHRKEE